MRFSPQHEQITPDALTDLQKRIVIETIGDMMTAFEKRYTPKQLKRKKAEMQKEAQEFLKSLPLRPVNDVPGMSQSELAELKRRGDREQAFNTLDRMINPSKYY